MRRPSALAVALTAACAILLSLLCVTLAALFIGIRAAADLRSRLQAVDSKLAVLSRQGQANAKDLSSRLSDLSRATRRDIGAVGRATRADVSRIREGLAVKLDEVTQKVSGLAALPRYDTPGSLEGAASDLEGPSAVSGQTPCDRLPREPPPSAAPASPAEEDLAASVLAREGVTLFESGHYEQAQETFSHMLASRPHDPTVRLYYAASLYRANPQDATRRARIERDLKAVLDLHPGSELALDTLSMLEIERGRWHEALTHLRALIAQQPQNPRFQKAAGFCSVKAGDLAAAHGFYHSAVELAPADVEALTSLGDCEWSLGSAPDARSSWSAALALLDPASAAGSRAAAELRTKLARSSAGEASP